MQRHNPIIGSFLYAIVHLLLTPRCKPIIGVGYGVDFFVFFAGSSALVYILHETYAFIYSTIHNFGCQSGIPSRCRPSKNLSSILQHPHFIRRAILGFPLPLSTMPTWISSGFIHVTTGKSGVEDINVIMNWPETTRTFLDINGWHCRYQRYHELAKGLVYSFLHPSGKSDIADIKVIKD
jgi:hypothetical protein